MSKYYSRIVDCDHSHQLIRLIDEEITEVMGLIGGIWCVDKIVTSPCFTQALITFKVEKDA